MVTESFGRVECCQLLIIDGVEPVFAVFVAKDAGVGVWREASGLLRLDRGRGRCEIPMVCCSYKCVMRRVPKGKATPGGTGSYRH